MHKITVDIKCSNCVKAKPFLYDRPDQDKDSWYECSRTGKEWLVMGSNPICKYWKPRVYDVSVWITRAEQALKEE